MESGFALGSGQGCPPGALRLEISDSKSWDYLQLTPIRLLGSLPSPSKGEGMGLGSNLTLDKIVVLNIIITNYIEFNIVEMKLV
jgi:hypothetical protein